VEPDDGLLEDLLARVDEELSEIDVHRRFVAAVATHSCPIC